MLVWMTLAVGASMLAGGIVVTVRVDRRWRCVHLQCCRCLEVWHSREKLCVRCGARGLAYDWMARRYGGFPTHDWQGYLDTGPIPVGAPVPALPPQRPDDAAEMLAVLPRPTAPSPAEHADSR